MLLLALGCIDAPPTWEETRDACRVTAPEVLVAEEATAIDAPCAETLGDALGLDWEAFGLTPGAVDADAGAVFPVLLGARALIASDYGTVGELLDDTGPWAWAMGEFGDVGLTPDDAASELFYDWVTSRVSRTTLTPGLESGGHYVFGGTVQFPAFTDPTEAPPAWMASVLVHEAGHATGPTHVRCTDGTSGCDPDFDGVYGAQALVLRAARAHLDPADPNSAMGCAEQRTALVTVCEMVNDPVGTDLCETLDEGCE